MLPQIGTSHVYILGSWDAQSPSFLKSRISRPVSTGGTSKIYRCVDWLPNASTDVAKLAYDMCVKYVIIKKYILRGSL